MEYALSAARWVVSKALSAVTDGLLEAWAASKNLGAETDALMAELHYAQAMLNSTRGREINNPALNELLLKLRLLAYDADDVLDELDYFRIQDELEDTYHAADVHAGGCVHNLLLHVNHTARAIGAKLKPSGLCDMISGEHEDQANSSQPSLASQDDQNSNCKFMQKLFITRSSACGVGNEPKLKFNRVSVSRKLTDLVKQLKPLCAKVSTILTLELLATKAIITTTTERPITSEGIVELKLYGRDAEKKRVIDSITGEYSTNGITILPIVGPGGIGKTAFVQHIYKEVKKHFQVTIWICVSLNFSANRLARAAKERMAPVQGEKKTGSDQEVIEDRLKGKRFLLVLDDIWKCPDVEWQKLLAPFRIDGGKGNVVIVTTRLPDVAEMTKTVDFPIILDRLGAQDLRDLFDACMSSKHILWQSDHPELIETGEKILKKLKGSPLVAKTVGRVLRKEFNLEHWRRVLDCKDWELETNENDIMPALKISYDYLPLHLAHCFSYCALFPEDYEFDSRELTMFWMGLGFLNHIDHRVKSEDVGRSYLADLVNYGFFRKHKKENGQHSYVIHDLLRDLALKVSRHDFLSVRVSEMSYLQVPASVRHISIIVDNVDLEDMVTYKNHENNLSQFGKRLKIEKLHTLMLFGENMEIFSKTIGNIFQQARSVRTVFIFQALYVEDMIRNLSNLVHLRHIRIKGHRHLEMNLPISRLYHLMIVDMENCWGSSIPSRDLNNLIHMQHIPPDHSDIFKVGKMKLLRELRRFNVKKEENGFELKELGQLLELEILGIYDLERVKLKEEADDAKLIQKTRLRELTLHWGGAISNKDCSRDQEVLESLKPSGNLVELCIRGHGGFTCPSWLGANLSVKNLEFLQLDDVSWKNLPPLGELWLFDEHGNEHQSWTPSQSFNNLKRIELVNLPQLTKWVGNGPSELFSHLNVLIIKDCPELLELPFSQCAGYEEDKTTWFPKLEELEITDCPKLLSLPCIPWSSATRSAIIKEAGSGIDYMSYRQYSSKRYLLEIMGKGTLDSSFWRVLAFHNLSQLGEFSVRGCPPLSLVQLEQISTLKVLEISDTSDALYLTEDDDHVGYQLPAESVTINECHADGDRLTHVLSYFPKVHNFTVGKCEKLTGFGVVDQQKNGAQIVPQKQDVGGDEEIAASASEGILLLPPQLQSLQISDCPNLVLCPSSLDGFKDSGQTRGGGGDLQGLGSLQTLLISGCPRFLSFYSSLLSSSCFPFPTSLYYLSLEGVVGLSTLLPLSNLTSLTSLYIQGCGDLIGEGLWPLLAEGRLTDLIVNETPNFFTGSMPSLPSLPPKLGSLQTDDTKVLAVPICTLLSSSLTELNFPEDKVVVCFTKEQEEALQLLTSLKSITFQHCYKLQGLPAGLHRLPNLKKLIIYKCAAIQSLPKDGLPSTLQELEIDECPAIQSLPKDYLPSSLQKLVIRSCPAIRSLPNVDDLPSSLHELDVQYSRSKELRRQCRKLIGTVPIVKA